MTLNFIHLKKELFATDTPQYAEAVFREGNIQKQVQEQGVADLKIWNGIITPQITFVGISRAFKQIVQDAKDKRLKQVVIAEDDIYFSHPNSWNYYLENMPKDFDLYLGCAYKAIINPNNKIEFGFSGLTLITIHAKFYDTFLYMKEMNNLDRELGRFAWKYKYVVCPQFICHQHASFSFHQGKQIEDYSYLLEGRQLYNG